MESVFKLLIISIVIIFVFIGRIEAKREKMLLDDFTERKEEND